MARQRTATKTPQPAQATRAAIYMRVSTEEQATSGYGLDVQRERCRAMATVKGWEIVAEYADEGISGTKDASGRPALAELLGGIDAGLFDAVIVLALDRLGRKTRIVLDLVETLTQASIALVSVKESLDTSSPQGQFVLTMFAALAQLERDNIVQRTTDGRNARGKLDGEKGGRVPFGYKRTDSGIEIVPEHAETVRYILRNKRGGKSLHKIAAELNGRGVASPQGGKWYARTVKIICDNRSAYEGGPRNGSETHWPRII